ncbi:hypothetical protein B0H16DRAFT_1449169 [Mycena metata]|uniref:Uncharacterized protein n=1 Tax=Mycena metata TaxID=1033252 RepID=A0AAD7K2N7_9AGAR|nr:hypothetical protein B0H16DRAFT_1449169 [Mycena metata]
MMPSSLDGVLQDVVYAGSLTWYPGETEAAAAGDQFRLQVKMRRRTYRDLSCVSRREHHRPTRADLALELRVVRACGARSAALRGCRLASNTVWGRVMGNIWLPGAFSEDRAEAHWRLRWLINLVAAAPTEFPDYADNMAKVLRPATWATLIELSVPLDQPEL